MQLDQLNPTHKIKSGVPLVQTPDVVLRLLIAFKYYCLPLPCTSAWLCQTRICICVKTENNCWNRGRRFSNSCKWILILRLSQWEWSYTNNYHRKPIEFALTDKYYHIWFMKYLIWSSMKN